MAEGVGGWRENGVNNEKGMDMEKAWRYTGKPAGNIQEMNGAAGEDKALWAGRGRWAGRGPVFDLQTVEPITITLLTLVL